jgi:hypothetical protein
MAVPQMLCTLIFVKCSGGQIVLALEDIFRVARIPVRLRGGSQSQKMRLQKNAYARRKYRRTFSLTNGSLVQIFLTTMKAFPAILFSILLTFGGITIAQRDALEEAARSALSGDPAAIRMLTDTVISQLPLTFHSTLNMSDRVFQAELQYRQQARPGVSIEQLVSALNQLANNLKLPAYAKTNANQVQTYRMLGARAYPIFLRPLSQAPNQPSGLSVSPSAAMFLLAHLLNLKMTDPSYQIDPDTWVRDTEAKRKEAASRPPSRSVAFAVAKQSPKEQALARRYEALAREIESNSDRIVRPVQAILKTLGL